MQFISASQVNQYRDCPRKWGFGYLANIKTPQHPAAALGTEVDDTQLQPYLRDGRPFDYSRESQSGYIAASILAYLPQPKTPGMQIQQFFEMPGPTWSEERDFGYRGYLDCFLPDSSALPDIEGGRPAVVDFKTTSNFRWAKTPESLATDVQAQLYATHAMFTTGAREVDLVWLYMQTKGARKAKRVHLRVTASHVAEQFENINTTAVEMYGLRREFDSENHHSHNPEYFVLNDLPPNPDACEAYGGCPFRSKCNLSPDQIVDAHAAKYEAIRTLGITSMSDPTEDLLAGLRKRQATPAVQAPTLPSVEQMAEELGQQAAAAMPAWATAGAEPPKALGINPPESLLPPAPPVGSVPIALVEPVVAIEKAKRGRPTGSKNTKTDTAPDDLVAEAQRLGMYETEFRTEAFENFLGTVGQAFLTLKSQLRVSK